MGNCLEYFCQSSEDKKEDLTEKDNQEEQIPDKPAEIPRENREFAIKRSECGALPSVDIDLPVLKLFGEPKTQTKSSVQHQEKGEPEALDGEPDPSGLETFFFQSTSSCSSSVQSCTGMNENDKEKNLVISSPKQIYQNKKIADIGIMSNEKKKKSMRKKLHLPKIKLKSLRKSRKYISTDDVTNGTLPLGDEDECELHLGRLKPLGVVRSEMPSKAMMVDDIFVTVHQITPRKQFTSLEDKNEDEDMQSPLPPSLRQSSWKEMYKRLIKKKEVAANKRLEAPPKAKENGRKTRKRRRKRSRAKRKPQLSSSDEDMASGLPLFRGCDVLVSTNAVLFEVEDTGYLASGEESD